MGVQPVQKLGRLEHRMAVIAGPLGGVLVDKNRRDVQAKMSRKVPVPMITGRNAHHHPGPVAGQNIISGPNRDLLTRDRVASVAARKAAADFAGFGLAIAFAAAFGL